MQHYNQVKNAHNCAHASIMAACMRKSQVCILQECQTSLQRLQARLQSSTAQSQQRASLHNWRGWLCTPSSLRWLRSSRPSALTPMLSSNSR